MALASHGNVRGRRNGESKFFIYGIIFGNEVMKRGIART